LTALLLDYINNITIFNAFLLTKKGIEENEYPISKKIKRININGRSGDLLKIIKREKIDILIYHFYYHIEMISLNKLRNTKIIYYNHSCFLIWIYALFFYYFQTTYEVYRKSKYIISLVPFESDYLLKKWGINSILMRNFITYEYNLIIPSDLSSKTILMIGRASDRLKRFELGVESMNYITKEIPDCKMKIISDFFKIDYLFELVDVLKIKNHIEFVGYTSIPEVYFKNASLHIFPSISESFGLVLSETKIFGIPNILVGLDYIVLSKGGTLIIYDDSPESIAKGAIKILTDDVYRKNLGREARRSMKKFKNDFLLKRWVKLILSVYNGYNYYLKLIEKDEKISKSEYNKILKRQLELLKLRISNFS
jgi:glycosyltransferase involved in cell wall biosynthesis